MFSKSCLKRTWGKEDWSKIQKEGLVPGLGSGMCCFKAPSVLYFLFFRARSGPEAGDRIRKSEE